MCVCNGEEVLVVRTRSIMKLHPQPHPNLITSQCLPGCLSLRVLAQELRDVLTTAEQAGGGAEGPVEQFQFSCLNIHPGSQLHSLSPTR